ncbi:MAG TPA: hypothetical protein VLD15_05905 [Burkholderiales bacterium]|nr:hypothetical protein [Burkholderiales bacterium]
MSKLVSAIALFLMSSPLFSAAQEMEAASAPAETVDVIWVALFAVIFIGSIIAFFVYLWHTERSRKPKE